MPENIGSCLLQMSVAKMTGQRARRSTIAGVGLVAKLSCRSSGMFPACPFRPNEITWLVCRHLGLVLISL